MHSGLRSSLLWPRPEEESQQQQQRCPSFAHVADTLLGVSGGVNPRSSSLGVSSQDPSSLLPDSSSVILRGAMVKSILDTRTLAKSSLTSSDHVKLHFYASDSKKKSGEKMSSADMGRSSRDWEYSLLLFPHVHTYKRPPPIHSDCFKFTDRLNTSTTSSKNIPASCKLTLKKIPFSNSLVQPRIRTEKASVHTSSAKKGREKQKQKQKQKGIGVIGKGQLQDVQIFKQLFCGGFAGVISRSAVAPLDLIKTYLITSHGLGGSQKTAIAIFKDIVHSSGWQGLFRGNLVNCIRVAPSKAIELCVFEMVRRELSKEGHPLKNAAATIAGGAAGMAGTFATYPLELLRTRISVQPELYTGLLQAVHKIFTQEGFCAFYSGLTPSLVGVFPYAATNYFVYDRLRNTYRQTTGQHNVPTLPTLAFGAVAAAASSAVTYPLEVARRHMQLSLIDASKKSSVGIILDIYKHEGFLALYRGLGTTWLKLIPAAGISFVCYEAARLALHIDDESIIIKAEVAEESDPIT